jgi:GNAT superfamily N-acetyltransferase
MATNMATKRPPAGRTLRTAAPLAATIRPARAADRADLLALVRAYYRFDGIRFSRALVEPALTLLLGRPALGRVWIMREGARPVGYVILTFNFDLEFGGLEGLVTDLFVHANWRGQGLGRAALATVDDFCRRAHIRTVELQVPERNRQAQAFYLLLGFRSLPRMVFSRVVK